ncbi:hypothetical protein OE88DRAFT_1668039 [Heliocybe sulcata]|uniref:Uncharacterized protein n=1 Tax=Heliocybe sulcata TaxID=5364 RepID=A0A5C3MLL0_9AGAM|nr:hypothetical protein OE88DRAFT_1668039 [Heliocybe sulcata]
MIARPVKATRMSCNARITFILWIWKNPVSERQDFILDPRRQRRRPAENHSRVLWRAMSLADNKRLIVSALQTSVAHSQPALP